ncbi:MAG TPA: hypothetical protein VGF86_01995 [Candidatus Tumulicola sp.]
MQDNPPTRRTYSDAETAADLATYQALKRSASMRSLLVLGIIALVAAYPLTHPALALAAGGVCGVLNLIWTTRSGERLAENRHVGGFVLSSFGRIALFGIVPVAFAALGPWWSMAWYFAGFFLPLGMFAYGAQRAFSGK